MNKYYITTPIYYVNSKPHIGHAYTTIAADILARYFRLKLGQDNVYFLTGTDEHGAKIAQAAEKEGKDTQKFTDEVAELFKNSWQALNIKNNDFIRTTEDRHEKVVTDILSKLKEAKTPKGNDVIYKDKYEGLYCVGCESYKQKEDLVDGKCPDHGKEPTFLSEENWYFRLSDYADLLKEKISKDEIKVLPAGRKKEVLSFIEHGLEDIAISRANIDWGIKVPFDQDQVIYVWVDALINYISALGYPDGELYEKFWPANTQLLAKDILKFHCVIWPAMLEAIGAPAPSELFVHGYFTIDGQKMSKTIGNVIDPNDLVEEFGADAARYLIVSQFPFGNDGDVKAEEFKVKYNADLANGIGNLCNRVFTMAKRYCDGKVPEGEYSGSLDLAKLWQTVDKGYSEYKLFENLQEIWKVIAWADGYINETKPWALDKEGKKEEVNKIIYNLLEVIRHIGWLVLPILPETGHKIVGFLGDKIDSEFENVSKVGAINEGTVLGEEFEALFQRKE